GPRLIWAGTSCTSDSGTAFHAAPKIEVPDALLNCNFLSLPESESGSSSTVSRRFACQSCDQSCGAASAAYSRQLVKNCAILSPPSALPSPRCSGRPRSIRAAPGERHPASGSLLTRP